MSSILTVIAERETGLLTPELLAELVPGRAHEWITLSEAEAYEPRCRAHWSPHQFDPEQTELELDR